MHTDTDDSMRVAVPVFPLGEAHGTLYDFYDIFHTYVGSSSALSLVFYHKTFRSSTISNGGDRPRCDHQEIQGKLPGCRYSTKVPFSQYSLLQQNEAHVQAPS